ncbi:unnamed protein product [Nippostrongylus brasiliensis]|uniref:RNAse_Pc domain-containing protein n=1 Tax=Nippostrongylus brasiliensis TaxID=27835 RepID=A0A0N4YF51_NIPBR|nr:unnamed protein product [Nippostrongylus brasiliensis]
MSSAERRKPHACRLDGQVSVSKDFCRTLYNDITKGPCRLDDATTSVLVQRGAVVQCSVLTVEYTAPLGRECSSKRVLLKCTYNWEFDAQTARRRVCKPLNLPKQMLQ